ncbi:MAG: hypothetical protein HY301_09745 [Verrucomicrobia bacterium]|nr:hypothetical protein [Verrucomicrobiota bacterium]
MKSHAAISVIISALFLKSATLGFGSPEGHAYVEIAGPSGTQRIYYTNSTAPPDLVRKTSFRPLGYVGAFLITASFTNRQDVAASPNDTELKGAIDSGTDWNHRLLGGATHAWGKLVSATNLSGGEVAVHRSQNWSNDCDGLEFRYRLNSEEIVIRQTSFSWMLMLTRLGIHEKSAEELETIVTAAAAKYLPDFAGHEMVSVEQQNGVSFFNVKLTPESKFMDNDWRPVLRAAVTTNSMCFFSAKVFIYSGQNSGVHLTSDDYFWFSPPPSIFDRIPGLKPKPKEP